MPLFCLFVVIFSPIVAHLNVNPAIHLPLMAGMILLGLVCLPWAVRDLGRWVRGKAQ